MAKAGAVTYPEHIEAAELFGTSTIFGFSIGTIMYTTLRHAAFSAGR